jgi:hypothetical protein
VSQRGLKHCKYTFIYIQWCRRTPPTGIGQGVMLQLMPRLRRFVWPVHTRRTARDSSTRVPRVLLSLCVDDLLAGLPCCVGPRTGYEPMDSGTGHVRTEAQTRMSGQCTSNKRREVHVAHRREGCPVASVRRILSRCAPEEPAERACAQGSRGSSARSRAYPAARDPCRLYRRKTGLPTGEGVPYVSSTGRHRHCPGYGGMSHDRGISDAQQRESVQRSVLHEEDAPRSCGHVVGLLPSL